MSRSSISSIVADSGRFTVLEMAPEMNGCTAPIIFTWPRWWIGSAPNEHEKTGRCAGSRPGAPRALWYSAMWATIASMPSSS